MSNVGSTPGLDIGNLYDSSIEQISQRGADLEDQMEALMSKEGGASPEDMIAIQFELGQYNTMLESLSTITKSLTDSAKSIAQRAG